MNKLLFVLCLALLTACSSAPPVYVRAPVYEFRVANLPTALNLKTCQQNPAFCQKYLQHLRRIIKTQNAQVEAYLQSNKEINDEL